MPGRKERARGKTNLTYDERQESEDTSRGGSKYTPIVTN